MQKTMTRRMLLKKFNHCILYCACSPLLSLSLKTRSARAAELEKGFVGRIRSPYYTALDDRRIRCELCPHACEIDKKERGACGVRENINGQLFSLVYGNPCAVNIDPIEKKPFYHILPGTNTLSFATAGCNLDCKFCQNWEISQSRPDETFNYKIPPKNAVAQAQTYGCASIAFSYVEPIVFIEYMLDICRMSRTYPMLRIMHSAGFINPKPLDDLCEHLDGACIDLKGFSDAYYRNMTGGRLKPVLNTLLLLRDRKIHTEIVTLLIPGKNDDPEQLTAMSRWICHELGPDVPVHFIRFYPRYKLKSIPPTPVSTLEQARNLAMDQGLRYVYIGNVPEHPAAHTYCPACNEILIKRIGYIVKNQGIEDGCCRTCRRPIPGIWQTHG